MRILQESLEGILEHLSNNKFSKAPQPINQELIDKFNQGALSTPEAILSKLGEGFSDKIGAVVDSYENYVDHFNTVALEDKRGEPDRVSHHELSETEQIMKYELSQVDIKGAIKTLEESFDFSSKMINAIDNNSVAPESKSAPPRPSAPSI